MARKRDNEEDEDEEDEDEDKTFNPPFNFFDIFKNPEKIFDMNQFKHLFKDIFQKIIENFPGENIPSELKNLSFEDMQKEFQKFMKNNPKTGIKGPFMAGWNFNFDPEGNPKIEPFGNIKPKPYSRKAEVRDSRDPLVEVAEEEDQIIVIAEVPGVTKADIELKADIKSLTISTKKNVSGRKYYKEVALPSTINPDYAKARYTNGILEVKLKKSTETAKKEIKID